MSKLIQFFLYTTVGPATLHKLITSLTRRNHVREEVLDADTLIQKSFKMADFGLNMTGSIAL